MFESLYKTYRSNEEGKRAFTDEVLAPLVLSEGHFIAPIYVANDNGEYIMLYRHNEKEAAYAIDVTADSIEALARDFMKKFLNFIDMEIWGKEYEKKFNIKEGN